METRPQAGLGQKGRNLLPWASFARPASRALALFVWTAASAASWFTIVGTGPAGAFERPALASADGQSGGSWYEPWEWFSSDDERPSEDVKVPEAPVAVREPSPPAGADAPEGGGDWYAPWSWFGDDQALESEPTSGGGLLDQLDLARRQGEAAAAAAALARSKAVQYSAVAAKAADDATRAAATSAAQESTVARVARALSDANQAIDVSAGAQIAQGNALLARAEAGRAVEAADLAVLAVKNVSAAATLATEQAQIAAAAAARADQLAGTREAESLSAAQEMRRATVRALELAQVGAEDARALLAKTQGNVEVARAAAEEARSNAERALRMAARTAGLQVADAGLPSGNESPARPTLAEIAAPSSELQSRVIAPVATPGPADQGAAIQAAENQGSATQGPLSEAGRATAGAAQGIWAPALNQPAVSSVVAPGPDTVVIGGDTSQPPSPAVPASPAVLDPVAQVEPQSTLVIGGVEPDPSLAQVPAQAITAVPVESLPPVTAPPVDLAPAVMAPALAGLVQAVAPSGESRLGDAPDSPLEQETPQAVLEVEDLAAEPAAGSEALPPAEPDVGETDSGSTWYKPWAWFGGGDSEEPTEVAAVEPEAPAVIAEEAPAETVSRPVLAQSRNPEAGGIDAQPRTSLVAEPELAETETLAESSTGAVDAPIAPQDEGSEVPAQELDDVGTAVAAAALDEQTMIAQAELAQAELAEADLAAEARRVSDEAEVNLDGAPAKESEATLAEEIGTAAVVAEQYATRDALAEQARADLVAANLAGDEALAPPDQQAGDEAAEPLEGDPESKLDVIGPAFAESSEVSFDPESEADTNKESVLDEIETAFAATKSDRDQSALLVQAEADVAAAKAADTGSTSEDGVEEKSAEPPLEAELQAETEPEADAEDEDEARTVAQLAVLAKSEADSAALVEADARALAKAAARAAKEAATEAGAASRKLAQAREREELTSAAVGAAEADSETRAQAEANFIAAQAELEASEARFESSESAVEKAEELAEETDATAVEARAEARDLAKKAAALESEAQRALAEQLAVLPAPDDPAIELRVLFPDGEAYLSEAAESELLVLATRLRSEIDKPVEIRAYWSADPKLANKAKLFSLKRGMKVRSYLNNQGIFSARIVLHRIKANQGPADLIDILSTP